MPLAVLPRSAFQMKRWGAGGVGRGPSLDGLLGAVSFLMMGISFRVPPVISRLVSRPIARLVARSVVVLRLVN